ncbi:excinuclease ABC subunit UvrC [Thiosulfativibrio zosterae]|uniref:UvrABC system protein C n=1 Tax=Thiosulfativibrio zosterae TaxID=2675053 RepID=A0A6F8PNC5_9GAMM|nr:excinuclease ABC subunit UvrC [Thiosulfativibrio zosterae]BBP43537.1 UvrABC system protein C [Thiosulfativibrio zosterae]
MTEKFDIQAFLKNLTERPGVYQMFNEADKIIYVGKAKNLKRRVSSYFNKQHTDIKTESMVSQVARIETIVTDTESEALILENTLIKKLMPKYNILFRDDKSYPYIYVSTHKKYPALSYHRGAKRRQGDYFGPFPNTAAVHQTLHSMQKIFQVRQCADSVFNHRSRPCLQYQIKRCSGPCVAGLVSDADYQEDVKNTLNFLAGKSFEVIESLGQKMQTASEALEFELAAEFRDKIASMRAIQNQHLINQPTDQDIDVIALATEANQTCLTLMMYRGGHLWGSQNSFPKIEHNSSESEIITAFITHHYFEHPIPSQILVKTDLEDQAWLKKWLSDKQNRDVKLQVAKQTGQKQLVQLAVTNALSGLKQHLNQKASQQSRVDALKEVLMLAKAPNYMECFDISHTQGNQTVASCVVFNQGVPDTNRYRKFNIEGITGGDDYAAMHQVLSRRYAKLKTQNAELPDLIVVDGGKGQLTQAIEVLKSLDLEHLPLVSVAKGEGRKAGLEILYTPYNEEGIDLEADDIALHLINHIRDEAHRFAITSHRSRRQKAQTHSQIEDIPGVGPKTRKKLLTHFGGLAEVKNAAVSELAKVPGISQSIAEKVYDFFHGEI